MSLKQLRDYGYLPNLNRDAPILFDVIEQYKQGAASYARRYGKYEGKKIHGQTPEDAPYVEATYALANRIRQLLKDNMPEEWDRLNRLYHLDTQIADFAEQRYLAKMGKPAQLQETMLGEIPTTIPTRAIARGYIKLIHSPGWNSTMAIIKDNLSHKLTGFTGVGVGAGAAAATSVMTEPPGVITSAEEGQPLEVRATVPPGAMQETETVMLESPDGQRRAVPVEDVEYYLKLGAKRVQ
jgi:hypothetical protein